MGPQNFLEFRIEGGETGAELGGRKRVARVLAEDELGYALLEGGRYEVLAALGIQVRAIALPFQRLAGGVERLARDLRHPLPEEGLPICLRGRLEGIVARDHRHDMSGTCMCREALKQAAVIHPVDACGRNRQVEGAPFDRKFLGKPLYPLDIGCIAIPHRSTERDHVPRRIDRRYPVEVSSQGPRNFAWPAADVEQSSASRGDLDEFSEHRIGIGRPKSVVLNNVCFLEGSTGAFAHEASRSGGRRAAAVDVCPLYRSDLTPPAAFLPSPRLAALLRCWTGA